ncbi:MAG: hypothetical protein ACOCWQ_04495 [Nanoarchaeota archaeon]
MIGKPEWFTYRIFGWGLRPHTWQGWAYIGVAVALVLIASVLPVPDNVRTWLVGIIAATLILDTLHVMTLLPKYHDERENTHQMIIERNVSFAAVAGIVLLMAYQAYQAYLAGMTQGIPFDLSLLILLGIMVTAKTLSTIYVKIRM